MSTPPPGPTPEPPDAAGRPAVETRTAPLPPPITPSELATLGQYQIVKEIGRGGMGIVYLARNTPLDRLEVLKVMNTHAFDRPGALERFQREMRAAARLSHTNVVTAYSCLQVGHYLVFAMEYVDGDDLAKVVRNHGQLPVAHAAYYVHQAARGLQHAFDRGMVHRDIKPSNLMLQKVGRKHTIKILDFGLAKASIEGEVASDLTGLGKMLGTPDFVAPEQTRDATNSDIRADLYSLGCTLYFLLAGKPPFKGRSMYEVLEAHQFHTPRPLNLVRPEVPAALAAVVEKMMAKAPAQRYQTPQEVIAALSPFIRGGGLGAYQPTPSDPNPDLRPPSDPAPGSRGVAETVPVQVGSTNPMPAAVGKPGPSGVLPVAAVVRPPALPPTPPAPPPADLAKPAVQPPPPARSAYRAAAARRPGRPLSYYAAWALWGFLQLTTFLFAATVFAFLTRGTADAEQPAAAGEALRFAAVTLFVVGLYAVLGSLTRDPSPGPGFRLRWRDWRAWGGSLLVAAVYGVTASDYLGFGENLRAWGWAVSVLMAVGLGAAIPVLPKLLPVRGGAADEPPPA